MKKIIPWLILFLCTALFLYTLFDHRVWDFLLRFIFPDSEEVLYPRVSLGELFLEHLLLVGVSSFGALIIGLPIGILVTRKQGAEFRVLVNDLGSFSQTIPPVAVLALAVPAVGFGFKPTIIALFLYSILPILRNTVSGLEGVPEEVKTAAKGMGMTNRQLLFRIEMPLAAPVIFAGIRISLVVNVGTATIGAVIGAGGLGAPIVSGLIRSNPAFVLEGAAVVAILAILLDQLIGRIENSLTLSVRNR